MRRLACVACVLAVAGLTTMGALAADWPGFQGPAANGTAPDTGLPRSFPAGGPKVLWTVKLGEGFGAMAVRDGEVFVLDRVDNAKDVLRCLDLNMGTEKWSTGYDAPGKLQFNGSRSVPAVDEKYVFTIGCFGQVTCFDRASHKIAWSKSLTGDFGAKPKGWGVGHSAVLYKDWVLLAVLSNKAGVVALEKGTGKVVWESKPMGPLCYVSPLVTTVDGVEQVVQQSGTEVSGIDIKTGEVLWRAPFKCSIAIPQPTPIGDGRFFVTGGYKAGSTMIKAEKTGEGWKASEVWPEKAEQCSQIHNGLLIDKHIYVLCNTNESNNGLVCFDLDGKVLWQTDRSPHLDKGNFIYADGVIWSMDGATGDLRIIQPDPSGYKELAKTKLLEGRNIWGPMALVDGKLLCRDQKQMKCVELKTK